MSEAMLAIVVVVAGVLALATIICATVLLYPVFDAYAKAHRWEDGGRRR